MRILFVQTGFLGDVILSTPVLPQLQRLYPGAEIWVMTTPLAEPLVAHHPAVFRTIPFDKRGAKSGLIGIRAMRAELRALQFDMVFSLHKSLRTSLLLWFAGIPQRFGFREAAGWFFYSRTARRSDLPHEALRNLAILRCVGCDPQQVPNGLSVSFPDETRKLADTLLNETGGRRIVGIAPGSVWATKRWTVDGFIEVARHFAAKGDAVVVLGGPDDVPIAESIVNALPSFAIVNVTGKTTILELAAVISRLSLLVSNDSAPLHLASAAAVPAVGVFCATVPEFGFGPWQTVSETVGVADLACRPCGRHGGRHCPTGTHACQLRLTAEAVIGAAERVAARAVGETAAAGGR